MLSNTEIMNHLQDDAYQGFAYAFKLQFSSELISDLMKMGRCSSLAIDYSQVALSSLFEIIYGFSIPTAMRSLTLQAALQLHCPQDKADIIGDAAYVATMLAQDCSPWGMLCSTATLAGKTLGYRMGFFTEKLAGNVASEALREGQVYVINHLKEQLHRS